MSNGTKEKLVSAAIKNARLPFHGTVDGQASNLEPMIRLFPRWNLKDADSAWCAAFVYYCLIEAGFEIPYSPDECVTCSLAGCGGWEEFAQGDSRIGYFAGTDDFSPVPGDIVLFDRVFCNKPHDHIGIVIQVSDTRLITAEGNVGNRSQTVHRDRNDHIRAFIRIPDGYRYRDQKDSPSSEPMNV